MLPRERETAAPTDARGGVVTFVYDANSNLLSLTDPVNNLTQWLYDALDRKAQETDPLGYSAIYAYDAGDRLTSATDRVGQRIAYAYDLLNRETGETWYNAGGTSVNALTFTYDANSNLLTAANNTATSTMAYDALDRKTAVQDPFGAALTYTYDAANNRTQMQDSFGATTTRVYDVLNRTTTMTFGGTGQTPLREDFTYTARDQAATQTRYSNLAGTTTVGYSTYGYDAVARLTNLQHQNSTGANIANYTNTYDLANRITSETLNGGVPTTYAYDATNELTNDAVMSYAYDANGNRTMTGYTTGPANELTSDGTWGYYYDANGNRVRKANPSTGEAYTYGYDNRNRLVSAQDATSAGVQMQATYVYDALGKRIEKDVTQSGATTTTRFAYDGSEIWADLSSSNALVTRYVRGVRVLELLARVSGGGTAAWVLADRMATVRALVDATGAVLDTITYDGYGNVTNETNTANGGQYKYVGYRYDSETGLYRPDPSTARYYVPATGNWNGRDPWGFGAGDVNPYRYVANNPKNTVDPSGLICTAPQANLGTAPGANHCNVGSWQIQDKRSCDYYKKVPGYDLEDFVGGAFRVLAIFAGAPCSCCEYQQERKGIIKITDPKRAIAIYGPQNVYEEETPPYGHREDDNSEFDYYYNPLGAGCEPWDRLVGCIYLMEDNPGWPNAKATAMNTQNDLIVTIDLQFRLRIIDICSEGGSKIVKEEEISFKCEKKVSKDKDK